MTKEPALEKETLKSLDTFLKKNLNVSFSEFTSVHRSFTLKKNLKVELKIQPENFNYVVSITTLLRKGAEVKVTGPGFYAWRPVPYTNIVKIIIKDCKLDLPKNLECILEDLVSAIK